MKKIILLLLMVFSVFAVNAQTKRPSTFNSGVKSIGKTWVVGEETDPDKHWYSNFTVNMEDSLNVDSYNMYVNTNKKYGQSSYNYRGLGNYFNYSGDNKSYFLYGLSNISTTTGSGGGTAQIGLYNALYNESTTTAKTYQDGFYGIHNNIYVNDNGGNPYLGWNFGTYNNMVYRNPNARLGTVSASRNVISINSGTEVNRVSPIYASLSNSVPTNQIKMIELQGTNLSALQSKYSIYSNVNALSWFRDSIQAASFRMHDGTDQQIMLADGSVLDRSQLTPSGLEAIDEGNGVGWRLIGQDTINHTAIGVGAIDLTMDNDDNTYGASGDYAFVRGWNSIGSSYAATVFGDEITHSGYFGLSAGQNLVNSTYTTMLNGYGNQSNGSNSRGYNFITGRGNQMSGGFGQSMLGTALVKGDGKGTVVMGVANEDVPRNSTEASFNGDLEPIIIVGNGTHRIDATSDWHNNNVTRSNLLVGLRNGELTLPSTTVDVIDNEATGKQVVTREWVEAQNFGSGGGGTALELYSESGTLASGGQAKIGSINTTVNGHSSYTGKGLFYDEPSGYFGMAYTNGGYLQAFGDGVRLYQSSNAYEYYLGNSTLLKSSGLEMDISGNAQATASAFDFDASSWFNVSAANISAESLGALNLSSGTSVNIKGEGDFQARLKTNLLAGIRDFEFPNENGTLLVDAPNNGTQYARQNGAWVAVSGGGGDFTETDPKGVKSASVTGTGTKTLDITLNDDSVISTSFTDLQGGGTALEVYSESGTLASGNGVATIGDFNGDYGAASGIEYNQADAVINTVADTLNASYSTVNVNLKNEEMSGLNYYNLKGDNLTAFNAEFDAYTFGRKSTGLIDQTFSVNVEGRISLSNNVNGISLSSTNSPISLKGSSIILQSFDNGEAEIRGMNLTEDRQYGLPNEDGVLALAATDGTTTVNADVKGVLDLSTLNLSASPELKLINAATYTLLPSDNGKTLIFDTDTQSTGLTINNDLPEGFYVEIHNAAQGYININPATGVDVHPTGDAQGALSFSWFAHGAIMKPTGSTIYVSGVQMGG